MNATRMLVACALPILAVTGCFWGNKAPSAAPPGMVLADPGMLHDATDTNGGDSSGQQSATPTPPPGPFAAPADPLAKVQEAGLNKVADNYFVNYPLHLKVHVSVFKDGEPVTVPANLGIIDGWGHAAIHTHHSNGVVFVVDETVHDVTLGQFFTVWGVDLAEAGAVYANGLVVDNPASLAFEDGMEIAVVFGTPPATIPSDYDF